MSAEFRDVLGPVTGLVDRCSLIRGRFDDETHMHFGVSEVELVPFLKRDLAEAGMERSFFGFALPSDRFAKHA